MTKILIIDDDPDVRTVMNVLMKKHGYLVETASHKEEALQKLDDFEPSVVLLSGVDGRELCKDIKANDATKEIQVMMISAHPGAAENIHSYGADDFISKPVNTELLLEKLERLVNAK
jgi:DNA-binding response OmpR family regulator